MNDSSLIPSAESKEDNSDSNSIENGIIGNNIDQEDKTNKDRKEANRHEEDFSTENADDVVDFEDLKFKEQERAEAHAVELEELRSDEELREMRYNQLLTLLSKSTLYVDIIKQRMAEDAAKIQERDARQQERRQKLEQRKQKENGSQVTGDEEAVVKESVPDAPATRSGKRNLKDLLTSSRAQPAAKRQCSTRKSFKLEATTHNESEEAATTKVPAAKLAPLVEHNGDDVPLDSESYQEGLFLLTGGQLRPYQREGYKWMLQLFENGMNGILADEMGLGKTVQVISMISYMIQRRVPGPFLIIAPLSTLPNWQAEFRRFAPRVPILLYYSNQGSQDRERLRREIRQKRAVQFPRALAAGQSLGLSDEEEGAIRPGDTVHVFPVVITSYELPMRDIKYFKYLQFKAVIVDEGHRLKNHNCLLVKCLRLISTDLRILLTGTPLQNNLTELWSLLNFLLPEIFSSLATFETWFEPAALLDSAGRERLIAQEQERAVISAMHQILSPFLLRRLKADVDLAVPPKREILIYCQMTETQQTLYKNTAEKTIEMLMGCHKVSRIDFDEKNILADGVKRQRTAVTYDGDGDNESDFSSVEESAADEENTAPVTKSIPTKEAHLKVCNSMMLFRRIVNHPYLIEYPLDKEGEYILSEDLVKLSGKMQILDRLLFKLKQQGRKVLLFSQMTSILNIIQDYFNFRKYRYSRLDGSMNLEDRLQQIKWFAEDPSIFVFLMTTRAGGLGLNLVAADTVVIFDSDWNPQCDLQAQDRCHRIGQINPVLVFRLLTANTIDQHILDRATGKRQLEKLIIHRGKFKQSAMANQNDDSFGQANEKKPRGLVGLSRQELINILNNKDYRQKLEADWISEEMIDNLLDRSDLEEQWTCNKENTTAGKINEEAAVSKKLVNSSCCRILNTDQSDQLGSVVTE